MQNILKRTRPGSEEEVQATQAYDALEKVRPSTQSPGGPVLFIGPHLCQEPLSL